MKIDACCTIGAEGSFEDTAADLIRQMDLVDIDMAVIHPADHFYACENETGNQMLLDLSKNFKGMFIPTVTVNPWRPDAWQVLSRYIEQGGKIVSFSPAVQGLSICDEKFIKLCEKIVGNGINIPIYFHSGNHSFGAPSQLFLLSKPLVAMQRSRWPHWRTPRHGSR